MSGLRGEEVGRVEEEEQQGKLSQWGQSHDFESLFQASFEVISTTFSSFFLPSSSVF